VPAFSASPELALERARAGQQSAEFSALVVAHAARVWRSLRYLGVRDAELADASQEVFLIVHRRLHEFRGDAKLETWLYAICLGVSRNLRRKQQRRRESDLEAVPSWFDPPQEAEIDQQRLRAELRWALEQITAEQREVFVLYELEELPMSAIAKAVGCPLFTAYSRLRLARKALARLLERALDGGVP
jgi:RNA polymerase sigma-70 factor (ECF subfamily)